MSVAIEDTYGNFENGDNSPVTLTIQNGPLGGQFTTGSTMTVNAVNGVATFRYLALGVAGTYVIAASDGADSLSGVDSGSFTITPATPNITWPSPLAITYGTPLSGTQLDATATEVINGVVTTIPGTFTYSPAAGTILGIGTQTLSVTFTPTDSTDYTSATSTTTLMVNVPFTTLASFANQAYADPRGGLAMDTAGNLYVTTGGFGRAGVAGTVLEMAHGTSGFAAPTGYASLDSLAGKGLIIGSAGNLYGTMVASSSSPYAYGMVFEVVRGSSEDIPLAVFDGADGNNPTSGVIMDAHGNLYGTTVAGGASDLGVVFEIPAGTSSIIDLASFNEANGANPNAGLIIDSAGNLYGTTQNGGANGYGTVFKIANGSGTVTTLASFTVLNGLYPNQLVMDSAGNLYGTTGDGGPTDGGAIGDPNNRGVVFELAKNSATITNLAAFNSTNGGSSSAALVLDSNGDLFGTTSGGGLYSKGVVFELAKGSSSTTTLVNFNGTNGAYPFGDLVVDSAGDLYGVTSGGGANGNGTVYELSKAVVIGTSSLTVTATYNGSSDPDTFGTYVTGASVPNVLNTFTAQVDFEHHRRAVLDQYRRRIGARPRRGTTN